MPIYEYRCQACGAEIEKLQKIADAPLIDCPKCAAPALKKKISAAGFRLSGTGWYETDFKTGAKKNLAGDSQKTSKSAADSKGSGNSTSTSKSTDKTSSKGSNSSKKPAA